MSLALSSHRSGEADRLFRAGAGRLERVGLQVGRDFAGHRRRVAVDLAQLEQAGCPHRAQRVPLALLRIDMNLHAHSSLGSVTQAARRSSCALYSHRSARTPGVDWKANSCTHCCAIGYGNQAASVDGAMRESRMKRPMEGVRIVEVAQCTFVPASGGGLAERGADVLTVEHAGTGDPHRRLLTALVLTLPA